VLVQKSLNPEIIPLKSATARQRGKILPSNLAAKEDREKRRLT
jgi:hypothetical protein